MMKNSILYFYEHIFLTNSSSTYLLLKLSIFQIDNDFHHISSFHAYHILHIFYYAIFNFINN